jgi:hypothetical protein
MTRFVMLLAAAAVAGVMYVAAAPGGLTRSGPTSAQFKALSKKVTTLQKQVTAARNLANDEATVLVGCVLYHAQAVDQFGAAAGTAGYSFTDPQQNSGAPFLTTALDLAPSSETIGNSDYYLLAVNPSCVADINSGSAALKKIAHAASAAH